MENIVWIIVDTERNSMKTIIFLLWRGIRSIRLYYLSYKCPLHITEFLRLNPPLPVMTTGVLWNSRPFGKFKLVFCVNQILPIKDVVFWRNKSTPIRGYCSTDIGLRGWRCYMNGNSGALRIISFRSIYRRKTTKKQFPTRRRET